MAHVIRCEDTLVDAAVQQQILKGNDCNQQPPRLVIEILDLKLFVELVFGDDALEDGVQPVQDCDPVKEIMSAPSPLVYSLQSTRELVFGHILEILDICENVWRLHEQRVS